jgi:hypothetical protein
MTDQTAENKHLEDSLANIRSIFEKVAAQIAAIKPGEKVPATKLAEDIAKEYGMTGPQLYPTLKFILNDKYPGVEIRKGAHGGVYKLDPTKPKTVKTIPGAAPVATAATAVVTATTVTPVVSSDVEDDSVEAIAAEKELQPIVNT